MNAMKRLLRISQGWLLLTCLTGTAWAAHPNGDLELGQLPDGRYYIKDEIDFGLKENKAREMSPIGLERRAVAKERLARLHPAVQNVFGGHSTALAWLEGRPLPKRVRKDNDQVPSMARSLKIKLKKGQDAAEVINELQGHPDVEWAGLSFLYPVSHTPGDPRWPEQWGNERVRADEAWDVPQATQAMRVAIVDTGVDLTHPDLAARIVYQRGFGPNLTGDARRDMRGGSSIDHGTHVAGIVGAIRDNGIGVAGAAEVQLMAMGCASWNQNANAYFIGWAADAINDAVANGADVINCSFGNKGFSASMFAAINHAQDHGVVVAAAGNEGKDVFESDSSGWGLHPWPVVVSNTTSSRSNPLKTGSLASNFGAAIDMAAPGTGILSTVTTNNAMANPVGNYNTMTGTSMASPLVAGGIAMVRSMNPNRIGAEGSIDLMYRMSLDLGPSGEDDSYGKGFMQLNSDYLGPLRRATSFVRPGLNLRWQFGTYGFPYGTLTQALSASPPGSEIILNGGIDVSSQPVYGTITIAKACTLIAFPDRPVLIGINQ